MIYYFHELNICLEIENDFKRKIQEHVAKLDAEKAAVLAQLEKDLNVRQELILESARKRIDDLNEEANRLKLVCVTYPTLISLDCFFFFSQGVFKEAQAQSSAQISKGLEMFVLTYIDIFF